MKLRDQLRYQLYQKRDLERKLLNKQGYSALSFLQVNFKVNFDLPVLLVATLNYFQLNYDVLELFVNRN